MNIFNKIVVILILIAVICLSIVGIFNSFTKIFKWSDVINKFFNPNKSISTSITILILLAIIIFCILLLVLEFYRKKTKTAIVTAVREGKGMITLESVASQVRENVSRIGGLSDVIVKVLPKSNGVILNIYSKISSDCYVPDKMQEVIKNATDFSVNKLGIKVFKVNLTITNLSNIKYEPSSTKVITEKIEKEKSEIKNEQDINLDRNNSLEENKTNENKE